MFLPVSSRVSFPEIEEKILKLWTARDIFKRSVENRSGRKRFTLYEGPPTANGRPGIHHVLSRVFKDVMPRYKTMKGYYAPRIGGWDTHGLPVELEVEKALGFKSKTDIERFGIAEFNKKCRESVFKYVEDWNRLTERVGYWVDLEHAYITMNNEYIETGWWVVKQLWDKGLVYQGHKVTPHCPRCGTSLSSHEVALGYEENTEDPSVYVKFKIEPAGMAGPLAAFTDKPFSLLAWTTTPWTLPANTALAVCGTAEYAVLDMGEEYLVLATERLEANGLHNAHQAGRVSGCHLVGLQYQPLFDPFDSGVPVYRLSPTGMTAAEPGEIFYPVIATDYVSMEDGTGIVHTAPAYGEVDYESGVKHGLYFIHHVDLQGKITGSYPGAGKFVKAADPLITRALKDRHLIQKDEKIHHTYPFCWRCATPLLYFAKQSWYIRTTARKADLIENNERINWYPEHIKRGRFGDWLQNNVDWAFSRERYWGTPVPVWRCDTCQASDCIGGVDELRSKPGFTGFPEPLDLHRPFVDEIAYDCQKCGGRMRRVTDVIDCWFDSGAMPVAQQHYPFDPDSRSIFEDGRFPADFICEGIDQTRGWFYSLHALSTLLFGQPCFKNVISLGLILDEKGEKMSKTRGNVVLPETVINKHGADAVRWYLLTASPAGNTRRFSEKLVGEVTRSFMSTLWNTYSFFVLYANIDNFRPGTQKHDLASELDRWILSELNQLIAEVTADLDAYDPVAAGRAIEAFVDYLSNWYVRRSRRRFWKSESDADKLSAYNTLYECLVKLSKLIAPFMPFLAEEIYQNLVAGNGTEKDDSVHLCDYPEAEMTSIDNVLSGSMRLAMKASSVGRAARAQAAIKVRQPLADAVIAGLSQTERSGLEKLADAIAEELNVKCLKFTSDADSLSADEYSTVSDGPVTVGINKRLTPELVDEGLVREITHRIQGLRKTAGFDIADTISTFFETDSVTERVMEAWGEYVAKETLSRDLVNGVPDDPGITAETFKLEGHAIKLGVKKTT
ncbi:isoleucine--tRNA ligase [Dehalogenimonas alkenigignens]|uniref:Isoleucine--tRNA ligase n=1 Tax=Dehalogenimonas alkenigignens TaxID=1217799 RepID=A0A0W0GIU4_9CHLR|nr:isoleucine--tRNA ligase [Dehalogenimonas alkenigignens]KTB48440.1 isoleucyl-tRNA synthase [Dehalogenimonas alkenigignens]PVV85106.1 isoleucine--tRNA ligase [Dehalogenimonas alkenigignens]